MKRRILAVLCMAATLVGVLSLAASATTDPESYQVGYAIKDMNPWVDPNDHSQGVLPIALTGNGNDHERTCTGMMDDNDDGVIGDGDGLHTTCTAVTDPYGTTVMYITIDSLQAYGVITKDVRAAIVEQLGADVITADRIMVNGSHSHSSAYFAGLKSSTDPKFKAYYQYVIAQITAAAIEAYNDQATATMTKGSINAQESTAYLGYNDGQGYRMNAIRHYNMEISNGRNTKQYVSGSNFGKTGNTIGATLNLNGLSGYKVTANDNAVESDNNMHVLQFAFDEASGKEPILLVNWRAHTTNNSGGDNKTFVSSDYVNSLRANLKRAGYRAAFLQGAAGNVTLHSATKTDWSAETGKRDSNVYGRILADIAVDCVERKMTDPLPVGQIRTVQRLYEGQIQQDSEGLLAAANQYKADTDALQQTNPNALPSVPYVYTHTDGKKYILNSSFHATVIRTRAANTSASYLQLELNAIMLGDAVAFVTAPNEIVDRYDMEGSLKNEDNDWLELVDEMTYGTPFVLGYTNEGKGYVPNSLNYIYNTDEYYEITGWGADGDDYFGAGSYEANTSRFARGTGEDIVQEFKWMLNVVNDGYYTAPCQACEKDVQWKPLIADQASLKHLGTGHYYLAEDLPAGGISMNQKSLNTGDVLCLDLNGHSIETKGRSFNIASNATLNLMDTAGKGKVISYSGNNNVGGGVVTIASNGNFNLYGGTLQFIRSEEGINEGYETAAGGVVSVTYSAKFTMYGGVLIGGQLGMSGNDASGKPIISTDNGCGATVRVASGGYFYLYGGEVKAGKAAEGGKGNCVYLSSSSSRMYLSGDAQVDNIYFNYCSGSNLYIKGTYTGAAALEFDPEITLTENVDIGNGTGTPNITNATLTCVNDSRMYVILSGSNIRLSFYKPGTVAAIHNEEGFSCFTSLREAADAYSNGYIKMINDDKLDVDITKDIYLDLNGCQVTGAVTVADGCTLYGFDSQTDDFTVSDSKSYGVLRNVTCKGTGCVTGVPKEWELAEDGYMMAVEQTGISFHRVKLTVYAMDLRAANAGIYYRSRIEGDELIARCTAQYGVALSVEAEPTAENLKRDCEISVFEGFQNDSKVNKSNVTGTLLSGILKADNTEAQNIRNGSMPIYGRGYVLSESGQYVFGETVTRTFKDQLEAVDCLWDTLIENQTASVLGLYNSYASVMESWNIPNIKSAAQHANDGVLKVLVIGNGHSMDAAELLYDVFKAENPGQNVVLGVLSAQSADMAQHSFNAANDLSAYTYHKNTGRWTVTENAALTDALADEQWDVIVLQQLNHKAGLAGEYVSTQLSQVLSVVKANQDSAPRIAWHMIWANPDGEYLDNASGEDWKQLHETWYADADGKYDRSKLYEKIAECTREQILTNREISCVIPAGTAIEYAQQKLGKEQALIYQDETHLSDYGQLIAAYVWYAQLMDLDSVSGVSLEKLAGGVTVTEEMKQDIIACVNWALANPCALSAEE